jgi:hypothetical protein
MAVFRIRIGLSWPGSGSPGLNTFHWRDSGAGFVQTDLDSALSALQAFYTSVKDAVASTSPLVPTGWKATVQEVTNVETSELVPFTGWTVTHAVSSATPAPAPVMLCVGWRTTLAARRGAGRTFIGPLSVHAMQSDGTPATSAVSGVQGAANTLVAYSTGSGNGAFGVWGLQAANTTPPPKGTADTRPRVLRDWTAARVQDKYAVLRSRRD